MNTHIRFACTLLFVVSLLCGCTSYSVDHVNGLESLSSLESIYIKEIIIHSEDRGNLEQSLVQNSCFSLRKHNYRAASFLQSGSSDVDYRHNARIHLHTVTFGDVLNPQTSTSLFFEIFSGDNPAPVAVIRITSNSCNIHDVRDQLELTQLMVTRLDRMAGR
ncbi:MAG: hypothetical protein ACOCWZ_11610 [Spirochaetota bacterium]